MDHTMEDLVSIAQRATERSPEQFPQALTQLIIAEIRRDIQRSREHWPGELYWYPETQDAWNMALSHIEARLRQRFTN